MAKDIPAQWEDFLKLGPLPTQVGTTAYGAICGGDPKTRADGVHVRGRGAKLRRRAEGARPHACARRALRRVLARRQRAPRFKPPGSKSFRRGCRIPECARRIRRTSSCTTSASTGPRATAASRSGSGFSPRLNEEEEACVLQWHSCSPWERRFACWPRTTIRGDRLRQRRRHARSVARRAERAVPRATRLDRRREPRARRRRRVVLHARRPCGTSGRREANGVRARRHRHDRSRRALSRGASGLRPAARRFSPAARARPRPPRGPSA